LFPRSLSLRENRRWVLPIIGEARETCITLTYPVLDSCRNLAFLVTGANKRDVLAKIRAGVTEMPAALVRPVGNMHWFADRAAVPT
jgi:6-phosphogluconolactonase